ncbi:MAG TPA: flagellar biosynthetic protein FliO [Vicinamibacterales bacterium]
MTNSTLAALIVLAGMAVFAWLVRTGRMGRFAPKASAISVETATSLGDRRQLVIVGVEGRRYLIGLTQTQVALLTELDPTPPVPEVPQV